MTKKKSTAKAASSKVKMTFDPETVQVNYGYAVNLSGCKPGKVYVVVARDGINTSNGAMADEEGKASFYFSAIVQGSILHQAQLQTKEGKAPSIVAEETMEVT